MAKKFEIHGGFGLVRDKNGKPRIDDPENLPTEIKAMLTDKDILSMKEADVKKAGLASRKADIIKQKGKN